MRSVRGQAAALAIAASLAASAPRETRASGYEDLLAVLAVGVALTDLGFTTYDVVRAANREPPARGAAIAEAIVATPQAVIFAGAFGALLATKPTRDPITTLAILPPMWTGALAAHGIWGAASDRVRPELLPALSLMIGTDATLSTFAIMHGVEGHVLPRHLGISAMVLTAPQIAVGVTAAVKSERDRNAWIGAVGWSGAIFVHGLVSTILGGAPPPEPPEPPPPPPVPEKPPLLVPASMQITPAVIPGAISTAPGVVMTGLLF
jgi:hypothetical protein